MSLEAAACVLTNAPSRCSHPPARPTPRLGHLLEWSSLPSSRLPCLPSESVAPLVCRLRRTRHACLRTPLLRVTCADAAAVVAPPHACSGCAYLPAVPDKPRLCHRPLTSESTALTLRPGGSTAMATSALFNSLAVSFSNPPTLFEFQARRIALRYLYRIALSILRNRHF